MNLTNLNLPVNRRLLRIFQVLALVGVVTASLGLWLDPIRTWGNLLLVSILVLGLGLAGALFVSLLYVTTAGWGVIVRRIPEALVTLIPLGGAALLAVLLMGESVYPWTAPQEAEGFPPFKQAWLNWPFFLVRSAIILCLWTWIARRLVVNSRRQDLVGGVSLTRCNVRWAALFLVVFALTFWLACSDWIMSLEPHWASTMFGPYNFAGLFLSGIALVTMIVLVLEKFGPLRQIVSLEHYHDLGKLLFAFSSIWMYLWFCQYMLIWYANIPEETVYYTRRFQGGWEPLMMANVILNWAIPFVVLLPRPMKRSRNILSKICIVVLIGRWLDLYLMIGPPLPNFSTIPTMLEVGILAGAVGFAGWRIQLSLSRAPLVPLHDPYLAESLAHGEEPKEMSLSSTGQMRFVERIHSRNPSPETVVKGGQP